METYVVAFIVLVIGNSVTNVVYRVTFSTGSLADIFRSIVTNMWRPPVIAFYVTLSASGISKSVRLLSRRLRQLLSESTGQ